MTSFFYTFIKHLIRKYRIHNLLLWTCLIWISEFKFSNIFCKNSHRTHFMYVTKSFRLLRVFWVNSHPVVLQLWEATVYFCLLKWGKQYASPYRRLECAMFNMIKEVPLMRLFAIKFLDYSNLILRIIITTYFTQACKVWSH